MSTILSALAVLAAATPGLLVSPAELAAALKDPTTVVVAVGNNPADFEPATCRARDSSATTTSPSMPTACSSELPPIDQLRAVLAAAGISDRSKVMIYGSPIAATRMFFTLDYLGHPNARVLNGGLNAWKANGGAIEDRRAAKRAAADR